jgi:hypothetical protein
VELILCILLYCQRKNGAGIERCMDPRSRKMKCALLSSVDVFILYIAREVHYFDEHRYTFFSAESNSRD